MSVQRGAVRELAAVLRHDLLPYGLQPDADRIEIAAARAKAAAKLAANMLRVLLLLRKKTGMNCFALILFNIHVLINCNGHVIFCSCFKFEVQLNVMN